MLGIYSEGWGEGRGGGGQGQRQEDQLGSVATNEERANGDLGNDTSGRVVRSERFCMKLVSSNRLDVN